MSEIVKVSSKGQITLPARLRKRFNIKPGTYLRFIEGENDFRVTLAPQRIASLRGKVAVSGPQDFKKARHAAMEERINAKGTRD
ncbi:MAG: antitoxin PrlF [Bacillota bacterium]|nr:antitoxin PrlF [Bacillota bacterium]